MNYIEPTCAARSLGPANNLVNTFLSTILTFHCSLTTPDSWPPDYGETALKYGLNDYDFIVVGSGTAGSVVAGRLAENINHKVLLLEAGGDPPIESEIPGLVGATLGSEIDWKYPTKPNRLSCLALKNEYCTWNKGKVLGGSHSINGMAHLRGNSRDYDTWEQLGNPTWGWNSIQKYFRKTENFTGDNSFGAHGTSGPMNVEGYQSPKIDQYLIVQAAKELGYKEVDDFVAGNFLGFGKVYGTLKDGRRMSTAKAFLSKPKPNLHIIKHAVARKIQLSPGLKAEGVDFVYKGKHELKALARKEVIVSAGTIETPKLLMLSGIGPKMHLSSMNIPVRKDLPVGENLQDHIRAYLYLKLKYDEKLGLNSNFMDMFYSQWVHRNGPLGMAGLDVAGFIDTVGDGKYPDVQLIFGPIGNAKLFGFDYKSHIRESIIKQIDESDRFLAVSVVLLRPKSRGYLRLQSGEYERDPLIVTNDLMEDADVMTIVRGINKLLEFENTPTFRGLKAEFLKVNLPECDLHGYKTIKYWQCYVRYMSSTIHHAVGTAKMGPRTDRTAVVDPELKVHGVEGLRVIDASIMPTEVSANINPAVIMLAEKGVNFVKNRWK